MATDVIISRRGGGNPVATQLNEIRCDWEINAAGMLSGGIPVSLLAQRGLPLLDLRGYWLSWAHPLLGRWTGIITSSAVGEDRVHQITAESHHVQLRRKFQAATGGTRHELPQMYPGQLMQWIFNDAAAVCARAGDTLYMALGAIENGTQPLSIDAMLADYYDDLIPAITRDIGFEWDVSPDRVISYGRVLGADKRGSVRIAEGVEIAGFGIDLDLWDVTNALTGIGTYYSTATQRTGRGGSITGHWWDNPIGAVKFDLASIGRVGVLAEPKDYGFIVTAGAIHSLLTNDLVRDVNPPAALILETVPIGSYWTTIRQGDIIRVNLGSIGLEVDYRVMVRAYNSTLGTLTLSGLAWPFGYQPLPNVFIPLPAPPANLIITIPPKKKRKKKKPPKQGRGRGAPKKKNPRGKR